MPITDSHQKKTPTRPLYLARAGVHARVAARPAPASAERGLAG
jgi:hypothetical protein